MLGLPASPVSWRLTWAGIAVAAAVAAVVDLRAVPCCSASSVSVDWRVAHGQHAPRGRHDGGRDRQRPGVSGALVLLGLGRTSLPLTLLSALLLGVGDMVGSSLLAIWTAQVVPDRPGDGFIVALLIGAVTSISSPTAMGALIPVLGLPTLLVLVRCSHCPQRDRARRAAAARTASTAAGSSVTALVPVQRCSGRRSLPGVRCRAPVPAANARPGSAKLRRAGVRGAPQLGRRTSHAAVPQLPPFD